MARCRWPAAAVVAAAAALAVAGLGQEPGGPPEPLILYPPDRAATAAARVTVVALAPADRPPRLLLDGKPVACAALPLTGAWLSRGMAGIARAGRVAWRASLPLKPGRHALSAGGPQVHVLRTAAPAPAGWKPYVLHSPFAASPAGCAVCHRPEEGAPAGGLAPARTPDACTPCHREADLAIAHKHVMDPFRRCQMCHDPHGAVRPRLLRDAREKLCTRCHEAGHYKD